MVSGNMNQSSALSCRRVLLAVQPVCLHLKAAHRGRRRRHAPRHPEVLLFDPRGHQLWAVGRELLVYMQHSYTLHFGDAGCFLSRTLNTACPAECATSCHVTRAERDRLFCMPRPGFVSCCMSTCRVFVVCGHVPLRVLPSESLMRM